MKREILSNITKGPFPSSEKVYVPGKLYDIRVAMREVQLSDTMHRDGTVEKNPPVTVYDTSGPYTDPNYPVNLQQGLPRLRENWILARGDVEQLGGLSSKYGQMRLNDKSLDYIRFYNPHGKPLRAKNGHPVTQLYYASRGIITPEMEYVAIRENQRIDEYKTKEPTHEGKTFGPGFPEKLITPAFVRDEIAAGRAIIPANINHPESEPMIIAAISLLK